jgi:hypothetical protein
MGAIRTVFFAIMISIAAGGWAAAEEKTFTEHEIIAAATGFFGDTTEGLATAVRKAFSDLGEPNGFITGEEIAGAFFVGLRYGSGELNRKGEAVTKTYWQGPSIGFDWGGNASKVFVLVYHLDSADALFQRYPGVDGSLYVVAGLGLNYQQNGKTVLAPIRTGVGLRAGANIGYLHYTKEFSLLPM